MMKQNLVHCALSSHIDRLVQFAQELNRSRTDGAEARTTAAEMRLVLTQSEIIQSLEFEIQHSTEVTA